MAGQVGFQVSEAGVRPPVTIVILAWNAWEATRGCLDSLRPTLGSDDQVVVVDNGSRDATPEGLRNYQWAEVITNPENRGFSAGCNQGAARATRQIIVFLNNDTLTPPGWLDGLIGAFGDPTIGAAGPRSNFVSGPQMVDLTGGPLSTRDVSGREMLSFASAFQAANRGRTSEVNRLVGFCLAVRRSVFETIGGFDESFGTGSFEDDDLCARVIAAGYRLVITHDSFVFHEGHHTFNANGIDWFAEQSHNALLYVTKHCHSNLDQVPSLGASPPLVSACLIVRDEEAVLGRCLSSLAGFVDEIVVYDTGSIDATPEIARGLGARVIQGSWNNDFARARNDALAGCAGDWVLWIDADEELVVEKPLHLRATLFWLSRRYSRQMVGLDGFQVRIENLLSSGEDMPITAHRAVRLFRREACEWGGRIHEQVVLRDSVGTPETAGLDEIRIRHGGYLLSGPELERKALRNVRAAAAEVADLSEAGHSGEGGGVGYCNLARSQWAAGRKLEALDNARRALESAIHPVELAVALACAIQISLFSGEVEEARGYLNRLVVTIPSRSGEEWGWLPVRLVCLLLDMLGTGDDQALSPEVVSRGKSLDSADSKLLIAQSLNLTPILGDRLLEACHRVWPDDLAVLACGSRVSESLDGDRASVWKQRLREVGL